jgi:hypothetical protein
MAVRSKKVNGAVGATGSTLYYTVPTGFVAKVDKATFTNESTTDHQITALRFGANDAASTIIPTLTVPADDYVSPSVSNHTLEAGETIYWAASTASGLTYRLSITERTQP